MTHRKGKKSSRPEKTSARMSHDLNQIRKSTRQTGGEGARLITQEDPIGRN